MTYRLLDGKALSEKMLTAAQKKVAAFPTAPKLVVIMVGEDSASSVYVRNKMTACKKVGITSEALDYPEPMTQIELLAKIAELNADPEVTGMIVQLPLPKHFY